MSGAASSAVVVVDAGFAVKWVLEEPYTPEVLALLTEWVSEAVQPLVPGGFAGEVTDLLFQRVRTRDLSLEGAQLALDAVMAAVLIWDEELMTATHALELAHALGQRGTHAVRYAALAERVGCECWTADEQFWIAARRACPWVRWIGEYRAGGR